MLPLEVFRQARDREITVYRRREREIDGVFTVKF
jgi:hypothetical protein